MNPRGISVNPKLFYEEENSAFNLIATTVVDDIFHTNGTPEDEYIRIGACDLEEIRKYAPKAEVDQAIASVVNGTIQIDLFDIDNAKVYENLVASLMIAGNYNTYVIAGGMGSGKTSTCTFIVNKLIAKFEDKGNFIANIQFDFNGPYLGTETEVISLFNSQLFNKLITAVERFLTINEDAIDDFCQTLTDIKKREKYYEFRRYRAYEDLLWRDGIIPREDKIRSLVTYIDSMSDGENISSLLKLISFISNANKNNIFLFVFDNIDVLTPACQRQILTHIFQYNVIAKVRCFVPLRRATFKRNLREILSDETARAAYTFGYIHHHGIQPMKVVLARTRKFLNYSDKYDTFNKLPELYKKNLMSRFETLKRFLERDNAFLQFFGNISGRSCRVALDLAKRFFVNNIISNNNDTFNYDLAIKALMANTNSTFLFSNDNEQQIANVLSCDLNGNFSFVPYLLLQYVESARNVRDSKILNIFEKIKYTCLAEVSSEEFLDGLNYLLSVRRPLIWSDDKSFFRPDTILDQCQNTLQLTELGKGYVDLMKHNTQYLQECLMSLVWQHDYVPQQFDSFKLGDRFAFLRKCIQEIFNYERERIEYESFIQPLSTLLFTTIGNSFAKILPKTISDFTKVWPNELSGWKSLRNELYNYYHYDYNSHALISQLLDNNRI